MPAFCFKPERQQHRGRSRGWLRAGVSLALVLLYALAGEAEEFYVRNWHMEDGLPDANVTALAQTPEGYLWVGTGRGLLRFDGTQFKTFDSGSPLGLPESSIAALIVDRTGVLWVAGMTGSLTRYERGRFQTVSPMRGGTGATGFGKHDANDRSASSRWMWGRVSELAEDGEHGLWAVCSGHALLRWHKGELSVSTATNGLPVGEIDAFCSDKAGDLWLTMGNALYCRHGDRWALMPDDGLGGLFRRLAPARAGGVWVAAPRGSWTAGGGLVRRFTGERWVEGLEPTPWTPNSLRSQVTALMEDRTGQIWLGTLWGGVFCSDATGRWQRVRTEGAFSHSVITCLFEDQQGAIWVGTVGEGLHRITRRPVTMLRLPAPADENIVTTSTVAHDGSVWVGTDGAGAFRYQSGEFERYGSEAGLREHHVCSLLEDSQTNLWAGTWAGLFQFQGRRFTQVEGPSDLNSPVLALFEDSTGGLWIGTPGGPVCRRNGAFKLYSLGAEAKDLDIRAFAEDASGRLWVGTIGHGLYRLTGERVEHFGPAEGFGSINARSLFLDRRHTLWVGSYDAGLFRFLNGRFIGYNSSDGLPSDTISSIIDDTSGNLWMGSDNGIFLCPSQLLEKYARGQSPPVLGQRLGLPEGLRSRGCSGSGQPVCSRTLDGRLWFPDMRGLATFDPERITREKQKREVLVESVVADGVDLIPDGSGEYRVPSTARRFEFHYTAPDLSAAQSLRFRHLLGGMDREWVDAGAQRVVYYSQLPPGRYQFRVMAGAGDGRWQEAKSALILQVVPRWWELRWVQVLAGVVLAAGVAGAIALNERQKLRRRLERLEMQQALEGERRRIARDLHDDLGARLTEIVLLGELAKRGEQTPNKLGAQVSGITQKVRQLVTAMEDVVWTVNPKNDSLPNLASYLSDHTERFLATAQLNCRLDVAETLPPVALTAHARHNLLLAVKEALNNAVRHAAAAQVRLQIHLLENVLRVSIEDDGRGFDPRHPKRRGNGLSNMCSRMEAVGGSAEIESEPGKGTTVSLVLPLPLRTR
jgi:ligand-binding sensor domain-containing protein/signal transduction histidine kinase